MRQKWVVLLLISLLLGIAGCGGSDAVVKDGTPKVQEPSNMEVKVSMAEDYIETELDPLVKSVASTMDTTWQYYFAEPVERFAKDGNREAYVTDIELCQNLLEGTLVKVDNLEVPESLNTDDKDLVNEIKENLHKAINSRLEIVEMALGAGVSEKELQSKVEDSNKFLEQASLAYKSLYAKNLK